MKSDFRVYADAWPYLARLIFLKTTVYKKINELQVSCLESHEPIDYNLLKYKIFTPIKKNYVWGGLFDCAWFKITGSVPKECRGSAISVVLNLGGEGLLYDKDGNPEGATTPRSGGNDFFQPIIGKRVIDITDNSEGNERIDLLIDAGYNGKIGGKPKKNAVFKNATLCMVNLNAKAFFYDYATTVMLYAIAPESERKKELKELLDRSFNLAFKGKYTVASEIIKEALSKNSESDFTFYATGHAHLDLAWLWPIRETKRKAARTYTIALNNIKKYDKFIFGSSQPQQYEWMKELKPELFEKVKKEILEGRIEPQGGMWVESDTNIPCGESLIRQVYYGKKFFRENFNYDPKVLWLPDVFGFSAQMPQIIKKTGMDYFLTIKLSWNNQNEFPFHTFFWKGIDGTGVLAHMPPEGTYNSTLNPYDISKAYLKYKEKDTVKIAHISFGDGDGGGGPSEGHLEFLTRLNKSDGVYNLPKIKSATAIEFFEELSKYTDKIEKYQGELYLERHQGTLTTQAKNKYYNRKTEVLLHNLDFVNAIASIKGFKYNSEKIDRIWKEVLLYQFHDIIPGSSIHRVYIETTEGYIRMMKEIQDLYLEAINFLSEENDIKQNDELYAINNTSFCRNEYIEQDKKWYRAEVAPYSTAKLETVLASREFEYTDNSMSNKKIIIEFSQDGYIASLKSKEFDHEFVKSKLNCLTLYNDKKIRDSAWDIDINYPEQPKKFFRPINSTTKDEGCRLIRETTYVLNKSTILQKVILNKDADYIVFETFVNWRESYKMIRADFFPSSYNDSATFDIQFGNIKRTTKNQTSIEKAQFEVCGHKWVDVTGDDGFGISVINDCKYAHRVKDGLISLNLLRAPSYPDKTADKGDHAFTYILYPHKGDVFSSDTVKIAYSLNNPLYITNKKVDINTNTFATDKNIVIETIKPTYKNEGVLLRIYEDSGEKTCTTIKTNIPFSEAYETSMIEDSIKNICDLNNLVFDPYEIKTIILKQ